MRALANLIIFVLICYCHSVRFVPTEDEIKAAAKFQTPRNNWGYQARQERSIRLFAMGGSNTRNGQYIQAIEVDFRTSKTHPTWNGTLDRIGIGGVEALEMVGRKFSFEALELSQWPNVVMLDFGPNAIAWRSGVVEQSIDATITVIRMKYRLVGLPEPAIMFIELFSVRGLVDFMNEHPNATISEKMVPILNNTDCGIIVKVLRNCSQYIPLRTVAAYYELPTVSWRMMAHSAFIRYYLGTNATYNEKPWEYMLDGDHIHYPGGQLLYDSLMRPFFDIVMEPRDEPAWNKEEVIKAQGPLKRMYPSKNRTMDMFTKSYADIHSLVRQPSKWETSGVHHNEKFLCSWDQTAPLELDITIPKECDALDTCSMSISFLHSWNTSYTGHLSCELKRSTHLVETLLVNTSVNTMGDGGRMQHTASMRNEFKSSLKAGLHTIKCSKLDSRLTCLTTIAASSIMEV